MHIDTHFNNRMGVAISIVDVACIGIVALSLIMAMSSLIDARD